MIIDWLKIKDVQYQDYHFSDGLFYFKKWIYVYDNVIFQSHILQERHNIPMFAHLGYKKTLEWFSRA